MKTWTRKFLVEIYTHTHRQIHILLHTQKQTYTHTYTHTHKHTQTHTHTYTHTHPHTQKPVSVMKTLTRNNSTLKSRNTPMGNTKVANPIEYLFFSI